MTSSRAHRRSAQSLVELLVAIVCLAGASSGILAALRFSGDQAVYARHQTIALGLVQTEIEECKGAAYAGTLRPGTTTQNRSNTGIPSSVSVVTVVSRVGVTALFTVTCTASWTAITSFGTQARQVQLASRVRFRDAG